MDVTVLLLLLSLRPATRVCYIVYTFLSVSKAKIMFVNKHHPKGTTNIIFGQISVKEIFLSVYAFIKHHNYKDKHYVYLLSERIYVFDFIFQCIWNCLYKPRHSTRWIDNENQTILGKEYHTRFQVECSFNLWELW